MPDITVDIGYRHLGEENREAYDLGLSVPLPIFNRNQGRIREAQANVTRTIGERETTRVNLTTRLRAAYASFTANREQAVRYRDDILPKATKSLEFARQAYRAGEVSILVLLDALRTWNETNLAYLQVLLDSASAAAELDFLTPPSSL
jgi:cobalt-zinc-cadmium efflux system outer membrane protein